MYLMPGTVHCPDDEEKPGQAAMEQDGPPEALFTAHKSISNTHEWLFAAHQACKLLLLAASLLACKHSNQTTEGSRQL